MAYHELAELHPGRVSEAELVQLTNDEVNGTTIVSDTWSDCATDADAEIDGYIGHRYALPLGSVPPLVRRLSMDITLYFLFRRRYPDGVPEGRTATYTQAVSLLKRISDGTVTLGVQPAAAANSEHVAVTVSRAPTFTRDTLKNF